MTGSPGDAIAAARARLDIGSDTTCRVWDVWDPDGPEPVYRLIEFGDPEAVVGIAAVDVRTGDVMNAARLPGTGPHMSMTGDEAILRAALPGAVARLVWTPSRQSRSPLYPIWEVRFGQTGVFVDMLGGVWPALDPGGPGGARDGRPT